MPHNVIIDYYDYYVIIDAITEDIELFDQNTSGTKKIAFALQ